MTITFGGGGVPIPSIGDPDSDADYPGVLVITLDGLTDRSVQ